MPVLPVLPVLLYLTSSTGFHLGRVVSQPPRLLTIPEPHQGTGEREIPPCLCICHAHPRACGGFRAQ